MVPGNVERRTERQQAVSLLLFWNNAAAEIESPKQQRYQLIRAECFVEKKYWLSAADIAATAQLLRQPGGRHGRTRVFRAV